MTVEWSDTGMRPVRVSLKINLEFIDAGMPHIGKKNVFKDTIPVFLFLNHHAFKHFQVTVTALRIAATVLWLRP